MVGLPGCKTPPVSTVPADLELGSFSSDPPWVLDHSHLKWTEGIVVLRAATRRQVPDLTTPARVPPLARLALVSVVLGKALILWALLDRRKGDSRVARRHLAAPPRGRRTPRSDLHQARPDHLVGRGTVPGGAGHRVPQVPRPGAGRVVRGRPHRRRIGARPAARGGVLGVRPRTPRGGVHRPGAPGPPPQRRGGRGQGPAPHDPLPGAPGPPGDGLAGPVPGRPDPDRSAGEPAGPGRALRRDDLRGAGLPARGREHARRGPCLRRARPARLRRAPPPPRAGHPPSPRHGTPGGLQVRRRGGDAGRRDRHRGGHPHRHARLQRGLHDLRDLPRRPARRKPVRPRGRSHRSARLRHHRPHDAAAAQRVPPPDDDRCGRRHPRPARRVPRPRSAAGRHRSRRGVPTTSVSTRIRSTRPR